MPGHFHGDGLQDTSVHHIADRGTSEVMSQAARHTRTLTRRGPHLPVVAPSIASSPAVKMREQERDHSPDLTLKCPHAVHLAGDESLEVRWEAHQLAILVGEPEQLDQHPEFTADRPVGCFFPVDGERRNARSPGR
jgi:hypothetical protein